MVVTGATGGLGRAVVTEFRERGLDVVAMSHPGEALESIGGEPGVHAVGAELADREAVVDAWRRIDEFATPTALVALAGAFIGGSLPELDERITGALWDSNVASLLWCCQQAVPRFESAGGGAIVTVGSRTAVSGRAPIAHAMTKAAVMRVSELIADEVNDSGIRANCVLPSVIDTPANRTWMSESLAERAVPPSAIAKVIAFLCGPEAWPISGARIPVYGRV
ncbi:SDR family NAD(P)-dependent oxidoreductase [Parasphingorhabdus pacifica]